MARIPSLAILLAIAACTACGGGGASLGEDTAANRAQDAALAEIAQALLQVESDGGYFGARFVASLDESADGKPLVRIYAGSPAAAYAANEVVSQAVGQNHLGAWFVFTGTREVRLELQQVMLDVYREQFTGLDFDLTPDPTKANIFAFETTLTPNPQHPQPMARDNNYSAFTMAAEAEPPISIITLNTGGENGLSRAIAAGARDQIEGTFLNEMMNALGTRDLQTVDFEALSRSTRLWGARLERDHGGAALDRFTITHSNHTPGSELLEMDLMAVRRILEEAARLEEAAEAGTEQEGRPARDG